MNKTTSLASDLQILRATSIASLIRAKIEEEIISGQRQGGDRLSEQELTRNFGVSRGPVREALRALEGQGLLEQVKNKGWSVKRLSPDEVEEVFEMRSILDKGLARLLASKRGLPGWKSGLASLTNLISEMDTAINTNDTGAYARLNQEFHDVLLSMVGNGQLTYTYRHMMGQLASHVVESLKMEDAMRRSNKEHQKIVDAIESGDEYSLCRIFTTHRLETQRRMSFVSSISLSSFER